MTEIESDPLFAEFQADQFERWKGERAARVEREAALADARRRAEALTAECPVTARGAREDIPGGDFFDLEIDDPPMSIGVQAIDENDARKKAVETVARQLLSR